MDFRIAITGLDRTQGMCRVIIATGAVQARSYPQPLSDNFRDLHANRILISERKLSSFFFGEEPVLNIEYLNVDLASAYLYKEGLDGFERLSGEFSINDALTCIDNALVEIEVASGIGEGEKHSLMMQVFKDFASGVYDAYQAA